ncbi:MAG TPA: sensor histidine kinase [Patescibacteria group bacterium]|nr:sensor histidine kinase [Patescibacteria group bacterium]
MSKRENSAHAKKAPGATAFFLLGTAVVLTVAIGGFVLAYARTSVMEQSRTIAERDRLFAHTLARSIDVYVRGAQDSVERLARTVGRGTLDAETIAPQIEDVLSTRPEFFVLMVVDLEGRTISGYAPDAPDEASRRLSGITIGDRQYFKDVIATRKPVVSEAIVAKAYRRPTVAVAAPIFDEKKEVVGVVAAALRLDELYDLAEYALGSEFAVPVVVDRVGHVLVHPDVALVAAERNLGGFEPAKRALRGEEGFLASFQDVDGVERSAAYMPIPELGWGVWIAQDTSQFAELRNKVLRATVPWGLLCLLGILGLFAALLRIGYGPMQRLAKDAREIVESGDMEKKVASKGVLRIREVETFAESFNDLLGAVRKMRDDLELANAAKSRFLAVTTHAFRTPISVTSWTLDQMLADIGKQDDAQRELILQLVDADKRIQLGFENLFAALELQGGTAHVEREKEDLAKTLRGALERMAGLVEARDIIVEKEIDAAVEAAVDAKKVSLVFDVLLANAIFYNRKGGKMRVTLRRDGDEAVIVVEDTGIGMPRDEIERVWTPFYRGEKAAKKFTDGTGLGLYIAKAYVELHGGSTDLDSVEGEWTRVTVKLPLRPKIV